MSGRTQRSSRKPLKYQFEEDSDDDFVPSARSKSEKPRDNKEIKPPLKRARTEAETKQPKVSVMRLKVEDRVFEREIEAALELSKKSQLPETQLPLSPSEISTVSNQDTLLLGSESGQSDSDSHFPDKRVKGSADQGVNPKQESICLQNLEKNIEDAQGMEDRANGQPLVQRVDSKLELDDSEGLKSVSVHGKMKKGSKLEEEVFTKKEASVRKEERKEDQKKTEQLAKRINSSRKKNDPVDSDGFNMISLEGQVKNVITVKEDAEELEVEDLAKDDEENPVELDIGLTRTRQKEKTNTERRDECSREDSVAISRKVSKRKPTVIESESDFEESDSATSKDQYSDFDEETERQTEKTQKKIATKKNKSLAKGDAKSVDQKAPSVGKTLTKRSSAIRKAAEDVAPTSNSYIEATKVEKKPSRKVASAATRFQPVTPAIATNAPGIASPLAATLMSNSPLAASRAGMRVGLSRSARVKPLHPSLHMKM